jgi:4-hydroxybenzoate polyprenyltransferase
VSWWDERSPGGRAKALIFLLHPGPSLLVTATFVAIAGLAARSAPSPLRLLQLVGVMLPIQFAIGVMNDVADVDADAAGKPYKPIVRGVVSRRVAARAGGVLSAVGLLIAATVNLATLALAATGFGAGLAYDLGLRRTPMSWLPWWGGIALLPLAAYAAAGALSPRLLVLLPLALLVALGLHCANALPDIDGDRRAGRRSLPVLLGAERSRWAVVGALGLAGVLALSLIGVLGQAGTWLPLGAAVLGLALLIEGIRRPARPFQLLAVATAVFAITWLASLPPR